MLILDNSPSEQTPTLCYLPRGTERWPGEGNHPDHIPQSQGCLGEEGRSDDGRTTEGGGRWHPKSTSLPTHTGMGTDGGGGVGSTQIWTRSLEGDHVTGKRLTSLAHCPHSCQAWANHGQHLRLYPPQNVVGAWQACVLWIAGWLVISSHGRALRAGLNEWSRNTHHH